MSILINGMEMPVMPKNLTQGEAVPYIDVRIFANGNAVTSKGERPYYTEYHAIPIPPHGRLIDADALEVHDGWMNKDGERNVLQTHITFVYSNDVIDAPTIIEAEVEES